MRRGLPVLRSGRSASSPNRRDDPEAGTNDPARERRGRGPVPAGLVGDAPAVGTGGARGCGPHGLPPTSDAALDLDRNSRRAGRELVADDSPSDEGPHQAQGNRPRSRINEAIELRRRHEEADRAENGSLSERIVEVLTRIGPSTVSGGTTAMRSVGLSCVPVLPLKRSRATSHGSQTATISAASMCLALSAKLVPL